MKTSSKERQAPLKSIGKATLISTCLIGFSSSGLAQDSALQFENRDQGAMPGLGKPAADQAQTKVQIAILLDTSSSMQGLIDQTKSQLWKVVNSFNKAEKNGKVPYVEVALYEYGNSGLNLTENYIRQIEPLTRDLDEVSKELFSLETNGGEEYCGAVITRATQDLKWDPAPATYKVIFIAGNEPFTQGPVDAIVASQEAAQMNIIVNTIHCGNEQAGISGQWKTGALAAGGNFAIINQDRAIAHIPSPQDSLLLKLNKELNGTYIPYGDQGQQRWENQAIQDTNAGYKAKEGAAVQRAITKCSQNYWNSNWDLCDASNAKGFDWKKIEKKSLPKNLQSKSTEELKAYVTSNQNTRTEIQEKMKSASKARALFIEKVRANQKQNNKELTLDQAIQNAVKAQAKEKGYKFK
ncbi:MAG: hypothetical protein ACJAR1_001998 [Rubritalea sp.]|jgi:hypothetical protein